MPEKATSETLSELFEQVKQIIVPFEKKGLAVQSAAGKYELSSTKPGLMIQGKVRDGFGFAALLIKSNYVGFYFTPIYTNPEIEPLIPATLLKLLKGKSCFHIKKWDDTLPETLRSVMETGLQTYRDNGWL